MERALALEQDAEVPVRRGVLRIGRDRRPVARLGAGVNGDLLLLNVTATVGHHAVKDACGAIDHGPGHARAATDHGQLLDGHLQGDAGGVMHILGVAHGFGRRDHLLTHAGELVGHLVQARLPTHIFLLF